MAKKIIRKPTRSEVPFYNRVKAAGSEGVDLHRYDWPAVAEMVRDGLIVLSPPIGTGRQYRRATLPGMEDW